MVGTVEESVGAGCAGRRRRRGGKEGMRRAMEGAVGGQEDEDQERNEEAASLTGKINSSEPANPTRPTLCPLSPLRSSPLLSTLLFSCLAPSSYLRHPSPRFPAPTHGLHLRLSCGVEPEPTHPHDRPDVPSLLSTKPPSTFAPFAVASYP